MSRTPINEKPFEREEVPTKKRVTFTGLISSGGQIIVPFPLRSGESIEGFTFNAGDKIELLVTAVYRPQE